MRLRRHGRFLLAVLIGAGVFAAARGSGTWELRFLLAGNTFFVVYLLQTAGFLAKATAEHLRRRAAAADEGLPLILLSTMAVVVVSTAAIFLLLGRDGPHSPWVGVIAVAGMPLGWLTLHTLVAFHYAYLFYAPKPEGGSVGGLEFPGTDEPGPWDFLYFSFVIGMTAQVSDVSVRTSSMRRAALAHGIGSFFYNTVLIALAVNAAATYGG